MALDNQMIQFFKNMFYDDSKGYISLLRRWELSPEEQFEGKEAQFYDRPFKFYSMLKMIDQVMQKDGGEDLYFSINNFMRKRHSDSIWRFNAFVLDFDFYKIPGFEHWTPEHFYHNVFKKRLLAEPTYVIDSGNGLYVIYSIYNTMPKQAIKAYKALYQRFYELYQDFGMDERATLTTQVIRVPGSLNTKCMKEVKIIEATQKKYVFNTLCDRHFKYTYKQYLNYIEQVDAIKHKQVKKPFKKITSETFKSGTQHLIDDLLRLIDYRNKRNKVEGYRELLIYLVRERLRFKGASISEELELIETINQRFKVPLSDSELKHCTKPTLHYKPHKKQTIIQKLEITEEEQNHLNYLVQHKRYVLNKIKAKRKKQSDLKVLRREKKSLQRQLVIVELLNKGVCRKNLQEALKTYRINVSYRTIQNDLQFINGNKWLFIKRLTLILTVLYQRMSNELLGEKHTTVAKRGYYDDA